MNQNMYVLWVINPNFPGEIWSAQPAYSRKAAIILFRENCPVALRKEPVNISHYLCCGIDIISQEEVDDT